VWLPPSSFREASIFDFGGSAGFRRILPLSPDIELIESDAELITRLQRGDRDAFTLLVRRWEGPLLQIAYRITGQMAEAEDVRQRVFLKLFEASGALRRPEQFAAWIRRAVVNTALSVLRQNKRRAGLNYRLREHTSTVDESHPGDSLIAEEQARRLAGALSQLEPEARALLSLRFDEDLTFVEIAAVLGQPASTIKSRLARTVNRLRGLLIEQDGARS
jgi:RNA polymerase sigma-70 factor (ECF subfamily)